jgi:antitoxin component of MazEF toxin-antitoxin module
MHTSTIRAAGGSIAVTIPQTIAITVGFHADDKVSFEIDAGRLVVSPVSRRTYTLQDLLDMQGAQPLAIGKGWDTLPATGREVAL